jgi:hypothetical protein
MTDQSGDTGSHEYRATVPRVYIAMAWLWVSIPFAYGVYELLLKVTQLFETR